MKKVFITGGSGFIGRNLVEQLRTSYHIFAPTSKELNLLDSVEIQSYLKKNKFDFVIHTATHNATITSDKDVSQVFTNNMRMFMNIVRCRSLYGRMFYFGSGAEYDSSHYIPKMKETYFDTHIPTDAYGFSKYVMRVTSSSMPNVYDLTLFGVFGKYEDWRIRFISNAICRSIYSKDITLGQNIRFDYLYIDDLVSIVRRCIEVKTLKYNHYNVCSGSVVDLASIGTMIQSVSSHPVKIRIAKTGFKPEYSGDNTRLVNQFPDITFTNMDQAIRSLMVWYLHHKEEIHPKEFAR